MLRTSLICFPQPKPSFPSVSSLVAGNQFQTKGNNEPLNPARRRSARPSQRRVHSAENVDHQELRCQIPAPKKKQNTQGRCITGRLIRSRPSGGLIYGEETRPDLTRFGSNDGRLPFRQAMDPLSHLKQPLSALWGGGKERGGRRSWEDSDERMKPFKNRFMGQ